MSELAPIPIVIVGHVDHGKSTFIGRLLHDTHNISPEKMAEVEKVSDEQGRKLEYAFITDQFQEERDANITIDTTQIFFKLNENPFVFIDAPGHKEYLKNMITGATQAENAIIMVDVNEGVREQTDKHSQILNLLGIKNVAIMINKMDTIQYSENTFRELERQIANLLKARGVESQSIVPISAYHGENVATRSPNMSWYHGPIAIDFLMMCQSRPDQLKEGDMRFPVQLLFKPNGTEFLLGRVEQGVMMTGQEVVIFPSGDKARVERVCKWNQELEKAGSGESVAVILDGRMGVKRGDILCQMKSPFSSPRSFFSRSFWASESPLQVGTEVQVECRTQMAVGLVEEIYDEINNASLSQLANGDVAKIKIRLKEKLLVERASDSKVFSRIVLLKEGQMAGCGVVINVES